MPETENFPLQDSWLIEAYKDLTEQQRGHVTPAQVAGRLSEWGELAPGLTVIDVYDRMMELRKQNLL